MCPHLATAEFAFISACHTAEVSEGRKEWDVPQYERSANALWFAEEAARKDFSEQFIHRLLTLWASVPSVSCAVDAGILYQHGAAHPDFLNGHMSSNKPL